MQCVAIQFNTTPHFSSNLSQLIGHIQQQPKNALILMPELALTGYAYSRLQEASEVTLRAIEAFCQLSLEYTLCITMTTKKNHNYYNQLYIFHQAKIIHTQCKHQLFTMNEENLYFQAGQEEKIKLIELNDIKIAALICFELRFIHYWQRLQGADIILVPAMWGEKRKKHYETLTQALAITNQCFVIAANSANEGMAKSSAIISPFGDITQDDTQTILSDSIDLTQIHHMRQHLNVGLQ